MPDSGLGFGMRLSPEELRRLTELARATGRTRSAVVRALIRLASPRREGDLQLIRQAAGDADAERGAADGRW